MPDTIVESAEVRLLQSLRALGSPERAALGLYPAPGEREARP